MLDNAFLRRCMTVPAVFVGFLVGTALAPLILVALAVVDALRWVRDRTPWMATRMFLFLWTYLLGEIWAVASLATVALLPRQQTLAVTYGLQGRWTAWNLAALRGIFGVTCHVTGSEAVSPGPILVLSRHTSLIDTLLPAQFITRPHCIALRYVLKRELLVDPALDIAGNRLPNCFVRRSGSSDHEQAALRDLGADLGTSDGLLIYPEGTRYTAEKRDDQVRRLASRPGPVADVAATFRWVLPPRPGGTLALLAATEADVVVLAHRGLEGLGRVTDVWNGGLVGSRVEVAFWRVPRADIPGERAARVEWLFREWARLDDWVGSATAEVVE